MIKDVINYLSKMQRVSMTDKKKTTLDFSQYTRKGTIPLGMDPQKWVEDLRKNDRI